ncbi:protein of unknown function [Candidatus Promineifilum breve]|uniref:DUF1269 domain-containing protein n=1 Tax=Candidatus Promineifilum breve TaxID=1806508 RepID=A0A160T2U7_9CHLR|nr:hypothetical protein [Candidatus Promineifilum breve]CUS04276.2 protein of unknown function [Candidatus Promineifilum breve]
MSNNKKLVWGLFESMDAAETAAYVMKGWDKASHDIKLGAIGAVYKNSKGSIKTKKFGSRNIGKGAEIGVILGVMTAVLPAVTLVGGLVAGAAGGAAIGLFNKKGLGLSHDELKRISDAIKGEQTVLMALADDEAEAIGLMDIMNNNGGSHVGSEWVDQAALDEADVLVYEEEMAA